MHCSHRQTGRWLTFACCESTLLSSASKSLLVQTRIQLAEKVYLSMSCFHDDSCSKASCSWGGGSGGMWTRSGEGPGGKARSKGRRKTLKVVLALTGTPTTPHWYTHRTTLVHPPHHTGTPTTPHWYTHHTTLVHPPHHTGTPTAPHWYTHRAVNGVDQHGTICTAVEVGSDGTISLMASRITLGGEGRGVCTWGVGWGCMCVPTTVNLTAEPFTVTILVFCCMIK